MSLYLWWQKIFTSIHIVDALGGHADKLAACQSVGTNTVEFFRVFWDARFPASAFETAGWDALIRVVRQRHSGLQKPSWFAPRWIGYAFVRSLLGSWLHSFGRPFRSSSPSGRP